MTRRLIVAAFGIEALLYAGVSMVVLDMSLHKRVQETTGVNIWGYRGSIAKQKRPRERRTVVLGGDMAFGSGLPWPESWPAYLQRNLNQRWRKGFSGLVGSVVNLAAPGDGAASFVSTLRDYEYLDYDVVCVFASDTDLTLARESGSGWRRGSTVFRRTGYLPMLPLVLKERRLSTSRGSSVAAEGRVKPAPDPSPGVDERSKTGVYSDALAQTAQFVFSRGKRVLVVTPPYLSEGDRRRQEALANTLSTLVSDELRLRYVNLGSAVDLRDRRLSPDGWHLTARGSDIIADLLTTPVLDLMK